MTRAIDAFFRRVRSDVLYFISAVLCGGAMNGLFAALVESDVTKRHPIWRLTALISVAGASFFFYAYTIQEYEQRVKDASKSESEKIRQHTIWTLTKYVLATAVTLFALYIALR